jgi:hypothetical protein
MMFPKEEEVEGGSRWEGSSEPTEEKCPLSFAKRVIFVDGPSRRVFAACIFCK